MTSIAPPLQIKWNQNTAAVSYKYQVKNNLGTVVRSGSVPIPQLTYSYEMAVADGGPWASMSVETKAVDSYGNESVSWTALAITSPFTATVIANNSDLTAHTGNTSNPHSVTAAQVGAATSGDLTAHTGNTSNPHSVTKSQVGLGNCDNTSDLNKPISTAQDAKNDLYDVLLENYTRHLQIPLSVVATSGTTDHIYAGVIAGKIINQNADKFYLQVELFADWVVGTDVFLELDWLNKTDMSDGETVILVFAWKAVAEGEDADSGTQATATVTYTASGTVSAGTMIHSRATIPHTSGNQPLTKYDHIYFCIYRDASTDTWSGDCVGTAFEYIYTSNGHPRG